MSEEEQRPSEHNVNRKLSPIIKWLIAGLIIFLILQSVLSKHSVPC